MYLAITKAITRYWGLKDNEPGVHALQCCAAAGADQEAQGEQWTEAEALAAYAAIRHADCLRVAGDMSRTMRAHRLPPPAETVRYLAKQAARLEAEAAAFAWGKEGKGNENGVPVAERG